MKIRVARERDDDRYDDVDNGDVWRPRWDLFYGGTEGFAGRFLAVLVSCEKVPHVAHSGAHGNCPHTIKVCVIRRGSDPEAYEDLVKRAGAGPWGGVIEKVVGPILEGIQQKHDPEIVADTIRSVHRFSSDGLPKFLATLETVEILMEFFEEMAEDLPFVPIVKLAGELRKTGNRGWLEAFHSAIGREKQEDDGEEAGRDDPADGAIV